MNAFAHKCLAWIVALAILFTSMTCLCNAAVPHADVIAEACPFHHHHPDNDRDRDQPVGHECCHHESTLVATPAGPQSVIMKPAPAACLFELFSMSTQGIGQVLMGNSCPNIHSLEPPSPPTSLLRLHCALLV